MEFVRVALLLTLLCTTGALASKKKHESIDLSADVTDIDEYEGKTMIDRLIDWLVGSLVGWFFIFSTFFHLVGWIIGWLAR